LTWPTISSEIFLGHLTRQRHSRSASSTVTGSAGHLHQRCARRLQDGGDKINAAGGFWAARSKSLTRDSKFKVDIGLSAAKELIYRENVDVIMGTINSALALAISDMCKKEKVPFFATFSKSAKITGAKGHRYVFSITENTALAGKAGAAGLAKKPYKNTGSPATITSTAMPWPTACGTTSKRCVRTWNCWVSPGGKSGNPILHPISRPSCRPTRCRHRRHRRPRLCALSQGRQSHRFQRTRSLFMHTATELSTLKPLGLDAPEGVIGTSNYFFYYPETRPTRQFVAEFKKAYNRKPAVGRRLRDADRQISFGAYEKTGAIDTEKFIDNVEGMTVDSPIGRSPCAPATTRPCCPCSWG
jgi:branched-chain amino acid transport system substrate-binding protein